MKHTAAQQIDEQTYRRSTSDIVVIFASKMRCFGKRGIECTPPLRCSHKLLLPSSSSDGRSSYHAPRSNQF
jgi:hypothetical protein